MTHAEMLIIKMQEYVRKADRPFQDDIPSVDGRFSVYCLPCEGFNLVFEDTRLPRLLNYMTIEKSEMSLQVPMKMNLVSHSHENSPIVEWVKIETYQHDIPRKFKASDWQYSGGGLFSRPNLVVTEWTEHKPYSETKVLYEETFENLLRGFKKITVAIRERLATNNEILKQLDTRKLNGI